MVEIIKGTFGYFDGRKVKPLSEKDGPQIFDPELEERLVKQGVARYVETKASAEKPSEGADGLPAYDKTMKLNDLKEIAKLYGVDASKCASKAEVCDLIDAKLAEDSGESGEDGDEEGDGEQPDLSPADPV